MAGKQNDKMISAALKSDDSTYIEKLAEGYYYGRGRDRSLKTALRLWEKAVEMGNADAMYYFGVCHYYGDGLPQDKSMAFSLWEQAAGQGHAGAKMSLENLRSI